MCVHNRGLSISQILFYPPDITGIVGIACTCHGSYALNTIMDLFKGEQQKNVDFALLQAIKTTGVDPEQGLMVIYDIIAYI